MSKGASYKSAAYTALGILLTIVSSVIVPIFIETEIEPWPFAIFTLLVCSVIVVLALLNWQILKRELKGVNDRLAQEEEKVDQLRSLASDKNSLHATANRIEKWANQSGSLKLESLRFLSKESIELRDDESKKLGEMLSVYVNILNSTIGGSMALSIKRLQRTSEPPGKWAFRTIARDSASEETRKSVNRDNSVVEENADMRAIYMDVNPQPFFASNEVSQIQLDCDKKDYTQMITLPIPDLPFSVSEFSLTREYLLCVDNGGKDISAKSEQRHKLKSKLAISMAKAIANEFSIPTMYLEEKPGSRSFRQYDFPLAKIEGWWINLAYLEKKRTLLHITVLRIEDGLLVGNTFNIREGKLIHSGIFRSLFVRAKSSHILHVVYRKQTRRDRDYTHHLEYEFSSWPLMKGAIRSIQVDVEAAEIVRAPKIGIAGIRLDDDHQDYFNSDSEGSLHKLGTNRNACKILLSYAEKLAREGNITAKKIAN